MTGPEERRGEAPPGHPGHGTRVPRHGARGPEEVRAVPGVSLPPSRTWPSLSRHGLRAALARTLLAADTEGPPEWHGGALPTRSSAERSDAAQRAAPGPEELLRDGDGAARTIWRLLQVARAALCPFRGSDTRGPRQLGTSGVLEEGCRVWESLGRCGAVGEAGSRRWCWSVSSADGRRDRGDGCGDTCGNTGLG